MAEKVVFTDQLFREWSVKASKAPQVTKEESRKTQKMRSMGEPQEE